MTLAESWLTLAKSWLTLAESWLTLIESWLTLSDSWLTDHDWLTLANDLTHTLRGFVTLISYHRICQIFVITLQSQTVFSCIKTESNISFHSLLKSPLPVTLFNYFWSFLHCFDQSGFESRRLFLTWLNLFLFILFFSSSSIDSPEFFCFSCLFNF
jgi:hypothetical protein